MNTNETVFDPTMGFDEQALTAWALGEVDVLDAPTRAAIEAAVAHDAALAGEVAAIQALASQLGDELASEPAMALTAEQREAIRAAFGAEAAAEASAEASPRAEERATVGAGDVMRGIATSRTVSRKQPRRSRLAWIGEGWTAFRGWSPTWKLGTLASAAIVVLFVVVPTFRWAGAWGEYTNAGVQRWLQKAASSTGHKQAVTDNSIDFRRVPPPPPLLDVLVGRADLGAYQPSSDIDLDALDDYLALAPNAQEASEAAAEEPPAPRGRMAARMPTAAVVRAPSEGEPSLDVANTPSSAIPLATPSVDAARKIIKDATLRLEVESVPLALGRIETAAAQSGGYVIETRSDLSQAPVKRATIKIGVPVDQFEAALARVRDVGTKVHSEQASGVDVSQEFVDVQSQVANLEATQARIREFLKQATSVEESLRVNAQLSEIEGQISQLKGRMRYLSERAAYSTITAEIEEALPAQTATPTVTPSPTPTPVPGWSPVQESRAAAGMLASILQVLATWAIWLGIVVVPIGAPLVLLWWGVRDWRQRQSP